jgi:hypothetical protein
MIRAPFVPVTFKSSDSLFRNVNRSSLTDPSLIVLNSVCKKFPLHIIFYAYPA